MDKVILAILGISIVFFLIIILIIIFTAKKTLRTLNDNKRYIFEQKENAILIKLERLELFQTYYQKKYQYLATFQSITDEKVFNLLIEEYDAKHLVLNEEYNLLHDGVVIFECYKVLI